MKCRYRNKIFLNEQNGYTIAVYSTDDSSVPLAARDKHLAACKIIAFTAIGYGLPLTDQIELEMEGDWETNDHGMQFKVENFMEIVPRTREGIIGYLASGAVKGIGERTAESIYARFGLQTLEVMERFPEELLKVRGISEKKLEGIKESFGKNRIFRELMTFLAPYHVTPKKANLILQKFKDESVNILRHRPYMMCAVKGFGFLTVDAIAKHNYSALDDPMRISGCIGYVMQEAGKEGHLFLEQQVLQQKALAILNKEQAQPVVTEQQIGRVLYRLVTQNSIVLEDGRIYTRKQYEEETQTASMIARMLLQKAQVVSIEAELALAQKDLRITLSEKQKEAVRMVFANAISIITGGPGTGKTTVLKVILYIHKLRFGTEVQLMAPTGRAARRMAESTGYQDASTMHMALGLVGDMVDVNAVFESLNAELINADEVSMVDMHLMYEFMRHINTGTRILLLGDVKQLPSVGPGDVFRQLITCGLIPVTVLDFVYRQGSDSNIPMNAQLMQEDRTDLILADDFQFISCKGVKETADIVKRLYVEEVLRHGIDQVQILTPYRVRTDVGVNELNKTLQDRINPPDGGKKELQVGSLVFRTGDKILQNKNTDAVSNGDMGVIEDFYVDEDECTKAVLQFSENRRVEYDAEQMEMVEHANAITIHKSQGSEYAVVIIPWVKAFYMMLQRNILYTAITRAKAKVYLVGEWGAVCQAIHKDDSGTRNTMLGERIIRYYYQYGGNPEGNMEQLRLAV